MSKTAGAPFPLPEKTKIRLSSSSPFSSLRRKNNPSSQKEKGSKAAGDPEYEEIGPQRHNKEIQNDTKNENSSHCDLCGSSDAEVRCDKCNCQAFCGACDETYHGHPKRANHIRKPLMEDVNHVRPPIPPKIPDGGVAAPTSAPPPQPPPRKNKKGGILPTFGPKDQNDNETGRSLMGSLKKIMGNRPLPAPPDQNLDKRRNSTPNMNNVINITKSSPALNYDGDVQTLTVALPQSIIEINSKAHARKPPSSMPPTPPSASQQYPKLQPKVPPIPGRKFSLQQFPPNFQDKRASVLDGNSTVNSSWDKQQPQHPDQQQQQPQHQQETQKLRSQSVSDEQWNQMLVLHGQHPPQGFTGSTATSEVGGIGLPRRPYNTIGGTIRPFGRGMVSSASVCDLNSLNQQQHQHQQQQQLHQSGAYPSSIHSANSFQQLSVMSYDPNMVWVQPSACTLCQTPQMYPQPIGGGGMKRTTSNISMNLSSVGSDITGYPWPHAHHHMPMGYPGYYPGCHQQHMVPAGYPQGSAMSIPDSMKSYNRRPPSPAPSARSSSHRSHKSSKSRSFNISDAGRRSRNHSRKRSEESEESESSSISDDHKLPVTTKSSKPGGLAWQCDHCTFINPGHVQACGMCSKVPVKTNGRTSRRANERRKSDKRRDKRTDSGENVHNISDYDNDHKKDTRRDTRLKSSGSVKSSSGRSKKKSRRRESSPSHSSSGSGSDDEDEEVQLETQLRDLRLTSRSRAGEYDGYSVTSRTREKEKERGSLKKEGGGSRYRNRRRFHSDRSITPARSTTSRHSKRASIHSDERSSDEKKSSVDDLNEIMSPDNEGTLVGTTASESNTLKKSISKGHSGSLKITKENHSFKSKEASNSEKSESEESSELEDPFDNQQKENDEPQQDEIENVIIVETQAEQEETLKNEEINEQMEDENYQQVKEKEYEQPEDKHYQEHLAPNAKGDVDEPSFANTLDGIETMGTNEVADYDPSSQALEYKIDDPEQVMRDLVALLPEVNYIPRITPENIDGNNAYDLYEKSDNENENIKENILYNKEKDKMEQKSFPSQIKVEEATVKVNVAHDPSYEVIDNPEKKGSEVKASNEKAIEKKGSEGRASNEKVIEKKSSEVKASNEKVIEKKGSEGRASIEKNIEIKNSEIMEQKETTNMAHDEKVKNNLEKENVNEMSEKDKDLPAPVQEKEEIVEDGLESISSENSNEVQSPRRDRQHTPLSMSSSDAQFYSPPNSPDLSLNEKLLGKRLANEQQVDDEDASSEGGEEEEIKQATITVIEPPEEEESQAYGNVTFTDARSHYESVNLVKASSDQDLSPKTHLSEKKNERKKLLKITKPKRNIRKEVIISDEEEEIDEKFLTVDELIKRRKQKAMKEQGLQLVQILREAEEKGYNPEEVSVAITLCEKNKSPVEWLQENWRHMVDTVMALASSYGLESNASALGEISSTEAKKALRAHKGNIWDAVTGCVEERQKKYNDLVSRGNFRREDIIKSLMDHEGDAEKAFLELSKSHQIGSFFSKIWGGLLESMPKVMPERSKIYTKIDEEKKGKILSYREPQKEIRNVKKGRKSRKKKVTSTNTGTDRHVGKQSKIYYDVTEPIQLSNQTDDETENEIYENFVNPLLEKLGDSLPKRVDGNPLISEELKRKIVQAILEGENVPANENVVFDSDEESTIEELLAVAENPTFYDYFTAVDLEDFEEISENQDKLEEVINDNEASTSSYDSPGTLSEEEKDAAKVYEEGPILTEGVQSDFEYFDEFKSVDNPTTDEEDEGERSEDDNAEPVQFIREEDVVVHPLKAYGHYADLSKTKYAEEDSLHDPQQQRQKEAGLLASWALVSGASGGAGTYGATVANQLDSYSKNASTFMQSMKWFFSLDRKADTNKVLDQNDIAYKPENDIMEIIKERELKKHEQEDEEEEEEESETEKEDDYKDDESESQEELESVSITTGRLNLSLTQSADKGDLGPKSHTVQTEQINLVQSTETQPILTHSATIETLQKTEEVEATEQKTIEVKSTTPPPPSLDPSEVEKIPSRSGPVTVQKATFIVGKAIAKAMARESSVRRDSVSSDSSSQVGSVPSPASTPELEELPEIAPMVASESDDEFLGSLDTIPEEEEFSERTESGRLVSRSTQSAKPSQKAHSTEGKIYSSVTVQNKSNSSSVVAPSPAPAKTISIPPAVASFSGPIFIPNSSSVASKISSENNSSHTYYNEPLTVDNNSSQKDSSNHYETIREALNAKPDSILNDADLIPQNASASSLPPPTADPPVSAKKTAKVVGKDEKEVKPSTSTSIKVSSKIQSKIEDLKITSQEKSGKQVVTKFNKEENKQTKLVKNNNAQPSSKIVESKAEKPSTSNNIPVNIPEKSENKDQVISKSESGGNIDKTSTNAKKPPAVPKKKNITKEKNHMDSSGGESEEEEEKIILDVDKIPEILVKVENMKNRKEGEVGEQEVQELKEQIQLMRKELESQDDSTDEDESNKSNTLKDGDELASPEEPVVALQAPDEDAVEVKKREDEEVDEEEEEEERTTGITDEDKQQYEQLKFDRTVRRLLAEGQATSYEKAELAAQLLNFSFDETDSIQAAEGCSSIYTALQFLQQECELCAEKYPMGKMVSMLHCIHRCCYDCANTYFSFQIKTKNVRELRCPFCNEPDLDASEDLAAEYLNNLDILLKNILDQETHELFQRKLRDWTLMKDPNFRWCNKCSSGFIANPRARKLICPDCKDVTCAQCRKQWEAQHTGITCEDFAKWKEENEPETQAESVARHLAENGITCPNCRFTYSLAKGGCMHFTCTECKFEFCSGCSQPFRQGAKCHVGPYCERLGLHSHHPRNCLFYLRDKEPGQLQQLLKEHSIEYNTEGTPDVENSKRVCRVQEQKETLEGLRDDICGRVTQNGYAGLCRLHYIEYLVEKINNHGLDPVSIFDEADLRVCLRRNGKTVPVRRWESEKLYRDKLIKLIKEQLPLS